MAGGSAAGAYQTVRTRHYDGLIFYSRHAGAHDKMRFNHKRYRLKSLFLDITIRGYTLILPYAFYPQKHGLKSV